MNEEKYNKVMQENNVEMHFMLCSPSYNFKALEVDKHQEHYMGR